MILCLELQILLLKQLTKHFGTEEIIKWYNHMNVSYIIMILSIGFRLISIWYANIKGSSLYKVLYFDNSENQFFLCLSWFILNRRAKNCGLKRYLALSEVQVFYITSLHYYQLQRKYIQAVLWLPDFKEVIPVLANYDI